MTTKLRDLPARPWGADERFGAKKKKKKKKNIAEPYRIIGWRKAYIACGENLDLVNEFGFDQRIDVGLVVQRMEQIVVDVVPMTDAAFNVRFAAGSSRSMRAPIAA